MATPSEVLPASETQPAELAAATPTTAHFALSTTFGGDLGLKIKAYRRYSYSVNTSGSNFIYKRHEYAITIDILPKGNQYTDATGTLDTAANIIAIFRNWLIAEIEDGNIDTETARQYVKLYTHTDPVTNPSFAIQFQAMLDSCPTDESSEQVDRLREECVAAFGWDANP